MKTWWNSSNVSIMGITSLIPCTVDNLSGLFNEVFKGLTAFQFNGDGVVEVMVYVVDFDAGHYVTSYRSS